MSFNSNNMNILQKEDRNFAHTNKALICTKPCKFVSEPIDALDGNFGICTRKICTFAHSLHEWQPPICSFDKNCNGIKGKLNNYGRSCKFKHSFETIDEWYSRADVLHPHLPLTHEVSRQPNLIENLTPNIDKHLYTIDVPTHELAEIAIKELFSKGFFDIKINVSP